MAANPSYSLVLWAVTGCLLGQQPKEAISASGVFLGRSGKPMAGARLNLCEVDFDRAKVAPMRNVPAATADNAGAFTFRGFPAGRYTIIYVLSGANIAMPNELDIAAINSVTKSTMPLMTNTELGRNQVNEAIPWGPFTLLKGHTYWSMGQNMKIYNATLRRGQQGPYLEVRRSIIWLQDFADKTQVKFDAWSF